MYMNERIRGARDFGLNMSTIATSGSLSNVATANTSFIAFTGASTINSFADGFDGKELVILNQQNSPISITNEDIVSPAANRIITGTGAALTLPGLGLLYLRYNPVNLQWYVLSGGGGATTDLGSQTLAASGQISGAIAGVNQVRVQTSGGSSSAPADAILATPPFTSLAPLNGTELYIFGTDSDNTITIISSDTAKGAILNGSITLGKYNSIHLKWNTVFDRWIEISRNVFGGF